MSVVDVSSSFETLSVRMLLIMYGEMTNTRWNVVFVHYNETTSSECIFFQNSRNYAQCDCLIAIRLLTYLPLINYKSAINKCRKVSVASCCDTVQSGTLVRNIQGSGDRTRGMLAIIRCRIFCLSVCCPKIKIKLCRTIILPVVTLREEHRLWVFEKKVLRKVFGPRRDELTGEWRRLHNEKPYDLYPSPNTIRVIKSRRLMGRTRGRGEVHTRL